MTATATEVDELEGLLCSNSGRRPRRVMIYGTHGIGKSTFGSCAPNPIFLPTEDGLNDLKVKRFPVAKSFGQFAENLSKLANGRHNYETAVCDSLDWLESLIWRQTCDDNGKKSIEDFGFGKGYGHALNLWEYVVDQFEKLGTREDAGLGPNMMVILIAHAKVQRFEDPQTDPYDRYEPNLHKSASAYLQEWCDEVLFARQRVVTLEKPAGSKTGNRGVSSGDRLLYTTERPSHLAKNRLALPEELPLAFASYWEAVQTAQARIDAENPF